MQDELHFMDQITEKFRTHFRKKFEEHGARSEGVDWGSDPKRVAVRYARMLDVIDFERYPRPSLLDVGCGYAGLNAFAREKGCDLVYSGIDVAENSVAWARNAYPELNLYVGDVFQTEFHQTFDYVVCNGILTFRDDVPSLQMDIFAARMIRRIYELCTVGAAFNTMSTKVNFHANNLYYRNPAEMLAWCMVELTPYVRIDHSYPLYDFTTYLYREGQYI